MKVALLGDVMPGRLFNHSLGLPSEAAGMTADDFEECFPELLQEDPDRIWGSVLPVLESCDVRIINLECAAGTKDPENDAYSHCMHPEVVNKLLKGKVDMCCLANNHALDMGPAGLKSMVTALNASGIKWAGVGKLGQARRACRYSSVGLLSYADHFIEWAATENSIGINYFDIAGFTVNGTGNINRQRVTSISEITKMVETIRSQVQLVVVGIHWGDNFTWQPPRVFQEFARALIDESDIDVVFGHSAHHVQGVEIYNGKVILYGCGDFLDDYDVYVRALKAGRQLSSDEDSDEESEEEPFDFEPFRKHRSDLSFMYIIHTEETNHGSCVIRQLELIPTRIQDLQVNLAEGEDRQWVIDKMSSLCEELGTHVEPTETSLLIQVS
ncbi:hypothetical protein K493DRAFT_342554 [Basidiobolus meristosporus CBS 931.73]|uniref:Capsule synthesis protein CapA domain-containing protein n=1 Tax=Basidiobolus meristosporus CBS 931.73 TaxID=1314790 RepID=A0A1Y1X526_9FUNG|nr:hypothetical protein K493DRAFT_342554 [Basidiobolus meristosporus CBS 931.73]|eukprot:ORX80456.1 hypothetical protein K493DRAFT_342554 [Basidiobolus meristosporus CBS 931.73]